MSAPPPSSLSPHGAVLLVDKPEGPTSHDVVHGVRRALGERRIGHAGTLDPFASGLLVLCLGPATRLAEYLSAMDKEYLAVARLGERTPTHDPESPVGETSDDWRKLTPGEIERALEALRGTILQTPPEFSAKKIGGVPAHRRARRGEVVGLAPVEVTVHALERLGAELPELRLRVACSSGTYVRALARDLGEALGVGAHLSALRRTRVGPFRVEDAVPPEGIQDAERLLAATIEPAAALAHLPSVTVDADEAVRLAQGQTIPTEAAGLPEDVPIAVLSDGALVAVASSVAGRLRPRKVFAGKGGE